MGLNVQSYALGPLAAPAQDHNSGTGKRQRQRHSAANRAAPARHHGDAVLKAEQRAQPLTDPAASPATIHLCTIMKRITAGTALTMLAAMSWFHSGRVFSAT